MKRINGLFEKVIDMANLRLADENARRCKRRSYGVRVHDRRRDANIQELHDLLNTKKFHTSNYTTFTIYEPKERIIYRLPYYPDRILHHAIMNIVEPIWIATMNTHTYSCIKKRGIHKCAQDVRRALRYDIPGTQYCLKIDIRKFYPSIDHDVLKQILRRKIKDVDLLWLLDEIIDSVDANPWGKSGIGIPIGNYLSQFFANLMLAYFDHWLVEKKGVRHYFRYADDIVIFGASKAELHALLVDIRAELYKLKLTVKCNYQVFPVDKRGVDFVGYVFRHTHVRLRKSIKQNLCRQVARISHTNPPPSSRVMHQQIASCWGWCKYCNSVNLINKLQKILPYDIKFARAKRTL